MMAEIAHMTAMGLLVSVLAPAIVIAGAKSDSWPRLFVPPVLALVVVVVVHGVLTVFMAGRPMPPVGEAALHTVLLGAAILFWLPVFDPASRLGDPLRAVYLFLAAFSLDLAGLYLVVQGNVAGGVAMIVAMLPTGLIATGLLWRWMSRKEEHTP